MQNIAEIVDYLRDIYRKSMNILNPKERSSKSENRIMSEITNALNCKSSDPLYYDLVRKLALKIIQESLTTDDTDELSTEYDAMNRIVDMESMDNTSLPEIAHVEMEPLTHLTTFNMVGMVWYYTLRYIQEFLAHYSKKERQEDALCGKLIRIYRDINVSTMFYNPKKFLDYVRALQYEGEPILSNITEAVQRFLETLATQLTYLKNSLQTEIQDSSELGRLAQLRENLLNKLTPENTCYFGSIILGSNAGTSKHQESYICGECGTVVALSAALLTINSTLCTKHVDAPDIGGYLGIEVKLCPNCHKFNVLPLEYMRSFETIMADENGQIRTKSQKAKQSSQMIAIGVNLFNRISDDFNAKAESDDRLARARMEFEIEHAPEIVAPDYDTLVNFDSLEDIIPNIDSVFVQSNQIMDMLGVEDIEAEPGYDDSGEVIGSQADLELEGSKATLLIDEPALGMPENKLQGDIAVETSLFGRSPTPREREILQAVSVIYPDKNLELVTGEDSSSFRPHVGFYLESFAQLFLGDMLEYSYTREDALISVLSPDKPYYSILMKIRQLRILQDYLRKLSICLNDLGLAYGCDIVITIDNIVYMQAQLEKMGVSDVLPDYDLIPFDYSDLNLQVKRFCCQQDEMSPYVSSVRDQIKCIDCSQELKSSALQVLDVLHNQMSREPDEYVSKSFNVFTCLLMGICLIAPGVINKQIILLEDEILSDIGVYAKSDVISRGDYTLDIKSPIYFLSEEFMLRVIDRVYYPMLKNTLLTVDLVGLMRLGKQDTLDPYSKLNLFLRKIVNLYKQADLMQHIILHSILTESLKIVTVNSNKPRCYGYTEYPVHEVDKLNPTAYYLDKVTHYEGYDEYVTSLICDLVNISVNDVMFENITGIDALLLDRSLECNGSNSLKLRNNLAIIASTPSISEEDDRAIPEMLADLGIVESDTGTYDGCVEDTAFFTESPEKDFDEDCSAVKARTEKLLLTHYRQILPVEKVNEFIVYTDEYDDRNG